MLCCPYIRRVSPRSGSLQNREDYVIKKMQMPVMAFALSFDQRK
ncbi:hypothetical protein BACIH_3697 [Bacillus amyloliquefaciens]|nr:hypothetical protein BACIH_3697 [Bacillus amyloliquefaciens]